MAGARQTPAGTGRGRASRILCRLFIALLCGAGPVSGARAQGAPPTRSTPERWTATAACPRDQIAPRDYNRCLYEVQRTAEQALEAEVSNAVAVIDSRADLPAVQRNRWKNLLDEAQSRFLIYRNFDCQSVAPFEGPRGIGNFEQRTLCLIDTNIRRAQDLRARYGEVPKAAAVLKGEPEARAGAWVHFNPRTVD